MITPVLGSDHLKEITKERAVNSDREASQGGCVDAGLEGKMGLWGQTNVKWCKVRGERGQCIHNGLETERPSGLLWVLGV